VHGQPDPEVLRFLDGHVDVDLEAPALVDGGEDVDFVTLSPTRTGMSPTTPAVGAVTR